MYNLFKVSYDEVTPLKRGFTVKNPRATAHLENIGISFLDGYHHSLSLSATEFLCRSIDQKEKLYRGFSYEGAAMGIAIKDAFRIKKNKQMPAFLEGKGNRHIYMSHVGIGWAYARLPFDVEKELPNYDPLLRWLIIDGYGFHQAYFKTKLYIQDKKLPRLSGYALHVFYQGVGRCLWFIYGTDISRISAAITSFSEQYREDLWAGLGLACVYAGEAEMRDLALLKVWSGRYLINFLQGLAFGAKARERAGLVTVYTESAVRAITAMTVHDVAAITDKMLLQIPEELDSAAKYKRWKELIGQEVWRQINN